MENIKKEVYEQPELEIIEFETEEIVTLNSSGGDDGSGESRDMNG